MKIQLGRISSVLFALAAAACAQQPPQQTGTKQPVESPSTGGDLSTGGNTESFNLFCQKAGETTVVQTKLNAYYARFCSNGQPTKLFTSKLLKSVYSGQGTPTIQLIEGDFVHDSASKTSAVLVGLAIQLPVSLDVQFNRVGPIQGDKELARRYGAEGIIKADEITYNVNRAYSNDGKYHVRGWDIHTIATNNRPVRMTMETIARNDQFLLEQDSAYLFTSYLVQGVKQIKDQVMFAPMVKVGDKAVYIVQIYVKADNLGQPSIAEETITKSITDGVKGIYELSAKFTGNQNP